MRKQKELFEYLKNIYPNHIVLRQSGSNIECFYEQAKELGPELGLPVINKINTQGDSFPLLEIPIHEWEKYRDEILNTGRSIAFFKESNGQGYVEAIRP